MRKLLAILTLALAALLAVPAAASADGYPPNTAGGQVSPGTVTNGGTVTFSGGGFAPGATITIAEDGEVEGTVTADADGRFSTTVTVDGVGNSVLTATGADADGGTLVVSATVRVLAASGGAPGTGGSDDDDSTGAGSSSGGLPRTGSEGTATQVWAGIGLLGLGAGMVALTVSRRRVITSTIA